MTQAYAKATTCVGSKSILDPDPSAKFKHDHVDLTRSPKPGHDQDVFLPNQDDINFEKLSQVIEHNRSIGNDLRELDRLCALREQPFFSLEEMRSTHPPSVLGEDPHGWKPKYVDEMDTDLPEGHCVHCRCTEKNCHAKQFSFYMELRVVQYVDASIFHQSIGDVREEDIEKVLQDSYNRYLGIRLFKARRVIDSYNEYSPPRCLRESNAWLRCFRYLEFQQMITLAQSRCLWIQD